MRARSLAAGGLIGLCGLLFSVGIAAAAEIVPGDLIKISGDRAVYYCGSDGKRYVFPDARTYSTWYSDFSGVKVVGDAEMAALPIGGNVTYRPGTRLIKMTSDPAVYAVEPGGALRRILSEAAAKEIYGDLWNKRIDDVPDAFFFSYKIGPPLAASVYPSGTVVRRTSDAAYFRIEDGAKRKIATAGLLTDLRLRDEFVIAASTDLSEYPDGADISTTEPSITDVSQKTLSPGPAVPTFTLRTPPAPYIGIGTESTLLELGVSSAKAYVVRKITVTIAATTNERAGAEVDDDSGGLIFQNRGIPNLTSIRLVDEAGVEPFGRQELYPNIAYDQTQTLVFTGTLDVPAGARKTLYLKARTGSLVPTGEGYAVTLSVAGLQVVDAVSGADVPFEPKADIRGPTLSTVVGEMVVAAANTPGNKTYVRGAKDVAVAGLSFRSTAYAPNVITSASFRGYIDSEGVDGFQAGNDVDLGTARFVRDLFPEVSLYSSAGVRIAGPETVDAYGGVTFLGLAHAIPAGRTETLVIRGDVSPTVDLGQQPDRVTFDIVDASKDVAVVDDKGGRIEATGRMPGGATTGGFHSTIRRSGTVGFSWSGSSDIGYAGREARLGTFAADAKMDGFVIKVMSFRAVGAHTSLGDLRLEYPAVGGGTASVKGVFSNDIVTFTNLAVDVRADTRTYFTLFGAIKSRESGAVYRETIRVKFDPANAFVFASRSSGEDFDETKLGGDLSVTGVTESSVLVRYGQLTVVSSPDTPGGAAYRNNTAELLRFRVKTGAEGGVRIKKLTFRVSPADAGVPGDDNDSLERWADVNGDFNDDDGIVDLHQIRPDGGRTLIGEDPSARIRYSLVRGGIRNASPSGTASAIGDYGLVEYEFGDGSEIGIGPGADQLFAFGMDTTLLHFEKDYVVGVALLGDADLQWTDIVSGAYSALTGADIPGLSVTGSVTVKK